MVQRVQALLRAEAAEGYLSTALVTYPQKARNPLFPHL